MKLNRALHCALLGGALATGCGSSPPAPPTGTPTPPAAAAETARSRLETAVNRPKLRVAIGPFQELEAARGLMDKKGWPPVGPLITEQVTTGLVQTGRVTVVERAQLDRVIGNLQTEKESDTARFFDQKTTADIGKFVGAQAVLVGSLTQFEPDVAGGDAGLEVGWLGGMKYHQDRAVVGVEIRLVDQETGKVLAAANGESEVRTDEAGLSLGYQDVKLGSGAWSRTPLGTATRRAGEAALAALTAKLVTIPWEAGVLNAKAPDKVFIDAGAELGVKPGDRFVVVHRGDAITGPDGAVMGYDETPGGAVEVVSVQPKMAIGKLVEGELPKTGDRVRLPAEDATP
ncbi:MAG: hypothetical protein H6704_15210 [Myxococcales bacterium]|nr:hypothetical protein [Myxococcales bacterium]